jgi:putative transposase
LWAVEEGHVWQRRFYDFNVWSARKRAEKLAYMRENPVKEKLVLAPDQGEWSSFRSYLYGEAGEVKINALPELKSIAAD